MDTQATVPLNLRCPVTLRDRLDRLAARFPLASRHRLAIAALDHGLAAIEGDPGILLRPAGEPAPMPATRPEAPAAKPRRRPAPVAQETVDAAKLSKRLARYREANPRGQKAIAREARCADTMLSRWHRKGIVPGPEILARLDRALAGKGY